MTENELYAQELKREIEGLRATNRWAMLGILLVVVLALAGLVWMIDHYFGGDGVRVFLIGVGIFALVAAIYLMAIGVSAVFGRQAMAHHNNVLRGIIDFQRADDYGEVARSVATGISSAVRSGTALDARVLQVANQIARQQVQQLTDSQPQATTSAPSVWSDVEDDAVASFRRVE